MPTISWLTVSGTTAPVRGLEDCTPSTSTSNLHTSHDMPRRSGENKSECRSEQLHKAQPAAPIYRLPRAARHAKEGDVHTSGWRWVRTARSALEKRRSTHSVGAASGRRRARRACGPGRRWRVRASPRRWSSSARGCSARTRSRGVSDESSRYPFTTTRAKTLLPERR